MNLSQYSSRLLFAIFSLQSNHAIFKLQGVYSSQKIMPGLVIYAGRLPFKLDEETLAIA